MDGLEPEFRQAGILKQIGNDPVAPFFGSDNQVDRSGHHGVVRLRQLRYCRDTGPDRTQGIAQFVCDSQQQLVSRFRQVYSTYQENRDLVAVGAYQPGSNPQLDEAIALWPSIIEFLRQHQNQSVTTAASLEQLRELFDAEAAQ